MRPISASVSPDCVNHSEQIALLAGEDAEKASAMQRFFPLFSTTICASFKCASGSPRFSSFYRQISQYIPIVVGGPVFLSRQDSSWAF